MNQATPRKVVRYKMSPEDRKTLRNTVLFYPCSGADYLLPIRKFAPVIKEFWFVDLGYFNPTSDLATYRGMDKPADKFTPVLLGNESYRLASVAIDGPPMARIEQRTDKRTGKPYPFIEPCVRTEVYEHLRTGKEIRVHLRRGYGFSTFRKIIHSLGVFFYRGDSLGEGGSGNLWLTREHTVEICDKLVNNGLLITDGSNAGIGRKRGWPSSWHLTREQWQKVLRGDGRPVKQFHDAKGRTLSCIGYVGPRYGPTLVWRVTQGSAPMEVAEHHPN